MSPTVYIWPPQGEDNPYGHVALKTDLYYISYWTAQVLESDESDEVLENQENKANRLKRKFIKALSAVGIFKGHQGGLVFCQDLDRKYEGDCDPIKYDISATVSNEDINSIYEEFLRYNGINPEDVTLSKGEELFNRQERDLPQKSLPKTQYSFSVELVMDIDSLPFYHKQQSCVSFTFNLIQTAWLKQHPDRPIPILFKKPGILIAPNIVRNNESGDMGEYAYEVPWFHEQVVQKYLLDADNLTQIPEVAALKICLGVLTRPFKLYFSVIFFILFLSLYFPWLFGLPVYVLYFYRYACELDSIFRSDWLQIGELLSNRINRSVIFTILFIYELGFVMVLVNMYEIFNFLLVSTSIEFMISMVALILNIIVFLEEKLSIIKELSRALTPLVYILLMCKRGFFLFLKNEIAPRFLSRN